MEVLKNRTDYTQALMPDGITILEGTTSTCPNCKAIAPFIEKLQKKYPNARFYTYNVDEAEDIAQELGARQVPNFTVFKDGMVQDGVTGAGRANEEKLEGLTKEVYGDSMVD